MKKLMTMLSAVAVAIGLQAADTGTSFEGLTAGGLDFTSTTGELSGGPGFWAQSGSVTGTYTVVDGTSVPRQNLAKTPNQFDEQDQLKYLNIQTTFGNALTRNVKDTGAGQTIGTDGFYFDSLVKFTAFDQDPTELQALDFSGAKIAVWLQETNPDAEGNTTNLYIYAGTVGGDPQPYNCGPLTDAGDWHRLTIKAIANIYSTGDRAGFVVFIDGQVKGATTYNTGIVEANLSDKYTGFYGARALFPSIDTTQYASVISSVAFDGQGDVDDIVFTATVPEDIPSAKDAEYVTVTWTPADITSIAIDGVAQTVADGSAKITYQGAGSATITVTYVEGKTGDNSITFNYTDAGDSYEVVASAAGASFNGTSYTTLAAAVAAANGASAAGTLKLFNASAEDDISINNANAAITIDLNGQTVGGISANTIVTIIDSSNAKTGTAGITTLAASGSVIEAGTYTDTVTINGGAGSITGGKFIVSTDEGETGNLKDTLDVWAPQGYEFVADTGYYVLAEKAVIPVVAAHPWYENPGAVVLAENLPGQTGNIVSAFHGQGEGEYLGLTYSTNPQQFDLFQVDGTNAVTTLRSIAAADATNPGFRGVAISKKLGIAMTLAYATTTTMYAYPLAGGEATAVVKPSTYSFDAGAFSPDGAYFFSNALNGESSNQYYVKWSVAVANDGVVTLSKVGSISAGGRGRSLAYARINGRDLVFGLVDTGKVVVMDMTDADSTNWTAADLITGLPAHSYGTLCVSGVNVVDALGNAATPHLTVATSTNNGATKIDVLNVYALTVPASGAVSQTSVKSFDEDALTAAGFGDISDANRYGNTVYVTDDEATIYFARPDNKLYAGQFAVARNSTTIFTESLQEAVDATTAGDTVTLLKDCNITTPLSISKNLTIHNDYTITGAVNYAICIGATVSFEGSGKIQRAAGITGSAFCVGANETTRGAITAGTAGTLIFNGGTVCGGSGGNLIKLENGTVTMNGGTLKDGLRGIKADADAGSYTSAIVINGGTITNCSAYAVFASAESANGKATITINGGEIAGPIGKAGKGDETITIPGTSAAKFDRDQSALCESGYETVSSDGWYVVQAIPSYTITFISGEGSTTNTLNVQRGAEVVAPTAAEVVGKTFDSWDPAVVTPAAGNAEYRAVYSVNTYAIKFVYGDNLATTSTVTTAYGVVPTAPSAETVAVVGKTFTGWNNEVVAATGAATYIAQYSVNTYAIKFVYGENLATTSTVTTAYGVVPTAPSAETVAVAGKNFDGWDKTVVAATADAIYIAQYSDAAPPVQPIVDGDSTGYGSEQAAKKAAEYINDSTENKAAYITPPAEAHVSDTATYYSMVQAKAVGQSVVLEVAEDARTEVQTAAETSAVDVVNGVENAAINVSAGLYYKITTDVSAAFDSAEGEGKTTIKGWSTGSVPVTKPGDTQGFIKVEVDAKPIQ